MAIMNGGILIDGIHPELKIQGSSQQVIFGTGVAPEPLGQLKLDNIVEPTLANPTGINLDFRNDTVSGFRLAQRTNIGDDYGTFAFKRFLNADPDGSDIFSIANDGSMTFETPVTFNDNVTLSNLNFPKLGIGADPVADGTIEFDSADLFAKVIFAKGSPSNAFDISGIGYLNGLGTLYYTPVGKNHEFFHGTFGAQSLIITPDFLRVGPGLSAGDFRKVVFFSNADNPHESLGIGADLDGTPMNRRRLRSQAASIDEQFSWFFGTSSSTSDEIMRLDYDALNLKAKLDMGGFEVQNALDPTTAQSLVTKIFMENYVTSAIDSNLGPSVALPFAQLHFNWANPTDLSGGGNVPYYFNHYINDNAPFFKKHIYNVQSVSPDVARAWQVDYDLGDPNAWNPSYSLTFYHPIYSPSGSTPFNLLNIGAGTSPVWGLFLGATVDMGGFEIKNALDPTTGQSLTTRNYVTNYAAPATTKYIIQTADATLPNAQALGALGTGLLKNTTTTGVLSIAVAGTDYSTVIAVSGTPNQINVANPSTSPVISISPSYLGQASISTLGTITTGIWNGSTITLSSGGTNANLTANSGGIVYSTATAMAILAGTPTANRVLLSGSSVAPSWSTATYPATTTANRLLFSSANNVISELITFPGSVLTTNVSGVPTWLTTSTNFVTAIAGTANQITASAATGSVTLSLPASVTITTSLTAGNMQLSANTLQNNNTNGDISILPNGTGNILMPVNTLFAKRPSGYLYMSNNPTGVASVANTWLKIVGSTTLGATSNLFDMPTNNRLRYIGTTTLPISKIFVFLTATYGTNATTRLGFSIFKNGSLITESPKYLTSTVANASYSVPLGATTSLSTNDYIETFFLSPNGGIITTGTDLLVIIE